MSVFSGHPVAWYVYVCITGLNDNFLHEVSAVLYEFKRSFVL